MKNIKILRIILVLFLISISFIFINETHANSINSINMDIYIDSDGDAHITETWNCNASQGTEVYHPYYNLGNSKITNLSVKEGNKTYTTLNNWNTSASFDNKAYKCGINNISDGVELCWGIGSYESHKYEVSYTITNFVSELTDSQMAYWALIPYDLSNPVGNVYIKIYSDFEYSQDLDVWGYGKYGAPCYVYDGYIEFTTGGSTLYSSEYMTILIKFPLGTFNAENKLYNDFEYYLGMAEEGSSKYDSISDYLYGSGFREALISFIKVLGFITLVAIFISPLIAAAIFTATTAPSHFKFGENGKKMSKDIGYFRDIPCNKNIYSAYFISYNYSIMRNKTDLLGTMLLKWLKEGQVSIEKRTVGTIVKKEETCVILNESSASTNSLENTLYSYLQTASKDNVLEPNEFKKWCSSNYTKILDWFDSLLVYEKASLVTAGKITEEEVGNKFKRKKYTATDSLYEDAKQLKGLKNFLKDLTLISKREPIEVVLFEEYLMFAQIFGIAKQVQKDFEKLYPDVIENFQNTYHYSYSDLVFLNALAHTAASSATAAQSRANSYDGGGGGFSSGGRRWRFIWWWSVVAGGFR